MKRALTGRHRTIAVISGVLVLHVFGLWALQTGLLQRAVELVVPVELLARVDMPAPPVPDLPRPTRQRPPPPVATQAPKPVAAMTPVAAPQVQPVLAAPQEPAPNAPSVPSTPSAPAANVAAVLSAPAPVASRGELASPDTRLLDAIKPVFPPISQRRGEHGRVLLHVLLGVDGRIFEAHIKSSSGYPRLDQAALQRVLAEVSLPRNGDDSAQAKWFDKPFKFELE